MRRLELMGQRFGHLVVFAEALSNDGATWWRCHCDCGRDCIKAGKELTRRTKAHWVHSCGCRDALAHSINKGRVNQRNDKLRALRR
jgi:hypothetical protein